MHEKNQILKQCIDLRACSYPNWYKKFRKISLRSICVPIPEPIVKYLLDEIIILPKECYAHEQNSESNSCTDTTLADGDYDDVLDAEVSYYRYEVKIIDFNVILRFSATRISRIQRYHCKENICIRWFGLHQNKLAQSERCFLDNSRSNNVL